MAFKDLVEAIDSDKTQRDRLIAVYIGILAVLLAVCGVGGGNAMKDATAAQHRSRQYLGFLPGQEHPPPRAAAADRRVRGAAGQPAGACRHAARALIDEKLKKYRADEVRLTSEPETGEGVEELKVKAKSLEAPARPRHASRIRYFDYGQALLQIAIVLASVAIITGGTILLVLSAAAGGPRHAVHPQRLLPAYVAAPSSEPPSPCRRQAQRLALRRFEPPSVRARHRMTTYNLLLLPGDGIGVETIAEVERIVAFFNKSGTAQFRDRDATSSAARPTTSTASPITDAAMAQGAEGRRGASSAPSAARSGTSVPYAMRPEAGLLRLRKDLGLFANLRPAICYPALADASSLKRELVEGLDIMIVRELTGGVYFGEPKEIVTLRERREARRRHAGLHDARDRAHRPRRLRPRAQARQQGALGREAQRHEDRRAVERGRHGDAQGATRRTSSWSTSWPTTAPCSSSATPSSSTSSSPTTCSATSCPTKPRWLTGSLGMLPSASLGAPDAKTGKRKALYEPVHGSAPDIAGKGLANPIATIASFGMALRYSFDMGKEADLLDKAIAGVLAAGLRTGDIMQPGMTQVGTAEMGGAILAELEKLAA